MRYARVMSIVAILAATATAAWGVGLPRNSVRSANIADGQVRARDLARGAVTGAKVADGSLTARSLAPGAVRPGAMGAIGAAGPLGGDGPAGPPAVDTQRLTLAAPGDSGGFGDGSTTFSLSPGEYTTEPGDVAIFTGTVTASLTSGTCIGGSLRVIMLFGAGGGSADAILRSPGTAAFDAGEFVDPPGSATLPVELVTTNSCAGGAIWHLDAAAVDITHVH
jgi:hypothetical protein